MTDDVKYLGGDYGEIELRVMAHEAEARQAAKAINRPKAPRW